MSIHINYYNTILNSQSDLMTTVMNKLSEWLNEMLIKHNMTQAQLARKARVSKGVISRYINNQASKPSETTLKKIAKAFGIPAEEIFYIVGYLDKKPETNTTLEEINYILATLNPDQQYQVKNFVRFLAEQKGSYNVKSSQSDDEST